MTDKLKPCMCGSTDLEILHSATYFVWCHKCFAKGSPNSSREEAVSSWNTRPIEDALLEALEEIAKGEGAFSRDPLTHASNTIENMKALAISALAKARDEA